MLLFITLAQYILICMLIFLVWAFLVLIIRSKRSSAALSKPKPTAFNSLKSKGEDRGLYQTSPLPIADDLDVEKKK